ncbi:MAG: ribosome-associated translation inhibitor RaiA [Bacteroidota bacterium]|nr:ribosome-associated translation inhibitor RaiA [Bacteroidota bacterium]MDP4204774.1 ribosome-associated translation inhibitor RaiA [Bacteroidota bacterium]
MNVKINAVHFTADQNLIDFIEKKVNKLDIFFEGIIGAEVMLKVDKPESPCNKVTELTLSVPAHEHLFAVKQADTFEESTDLAVDAIEKQLKKFKEKLKVK